MYANYNLTRCFLFSTNCKVKKMNHKYCLLYRFFLVLLMFFTAYLIPYQGVACAAGQGLQSGRIKINSRIKVESQYSDNVFRSDSDKKNDLITKALPQVLLTYAFAPENTFSAEYEGDFRYYRNFDNFSKAHNHGKLRWKWLQPMGSKLEVGAKLDDSAIQPYSEEQQTKDYLYWQLYFDTLFKIGSSMETGLKLETSSRKFDDTIWSIDDYDTYGLTYYFGYGKWAFTSLIFEYSYLHQDNNEFLGISTDSDVHTVLAGPRWEVGSRLTGQLLGGYSTISGDNFSDNSGFSLNADLEYLYSDFTRLKLAAYQQINSSTRSARESNVYNIATGGSFTTEYSRWDPLLFTMRLSYKNQDFDGIDIEQEDRTDDYYQAGLKAEYSIRQWLLLGVEYQYREKDSTVDAVEYGENRATVGLTFSL